MKYVADDGKEFDNEKACKIYEVSQKKPAILKVKNIIINVEMSDGLSHFIICKNIKDGGKINMERHTYDPDDLFTDSDICKATINFDCMGDDVVIV